MEEAKIREQIGQRLVEARNALGLSQEKAASLLDVHRNVLHEWEAGKKLATVKDLRKAAEIYDRDITFFTSKKEEDAFTVLLRTVSHDKAVYERAVNFEKFCSNYKRLCQVLEYKNNVPVIPDYAIDQSRPLIEWMAHYAEEARDLLGLGKGPITNLRETLETKLHLKIYFEKLPERISGIFTYSQSIGGSIMINTENRTAGHQHFSLAHEFAHFLFHRSLRALISNNSKTKEEIEADLFAEHFLMPAQAVRDSFYDRIKGDVSEEDVLYLADLYRVSFKAMTYRLKTLKLINRSTTDDLFENTKINLLRQITGFQEPSVSNEKFPKVYVHLLVKAFRQKRITASALSDYLDIDLWSARQEAKKFESLVEHASA
jgi:Zn-dependent peptidase ImmA (M78 family)/transcriptional regulator with XRE-family HTH domain